MDVAFHLASPAQKAPEVMALPPHKFPEFQKTDLLHLDTGVGLDTPKKVGASPRRETVAFRGIPEEADSVPHGVMIPTKGWGVQKPRSDAYMSAAEGSCPYSNASRSSLIRAW